MDKKVVQTIRRDCRRIMLPCYIIYGLSIFLQFLVPTLSSWLIGDMTNALLTLDVDDIRARLVPFFVAILLEAVVLPLIEIGKNLLIVKRAAHYEVFLIERLLRRPISALFGETGASVAEHTIVHTPDYYYVQMSIFSLPISILLYGGILLAMLYIGKLHILFVVVIMLLAAVPLLRTALMGKLNAKVTAEERNYKTERARKEESLFHARSFFWSNHLEDDCLSAFHQRFAAWYSSSGQKKNNVEAIRTVFRYICNYGTPLCAILAGSVLVWAGQMSLGSLVTGYLLLPTLTKFYFTISYQVEELQKEKKSQERLAVFYGRAASDLNDMESNLPQEVPTVQALCFHQVSYTYPEACESILSQWSGVFSREETIQIQGKNGSGKTTLARLLSGLYAPQSGSITDEKGTVLSKEILRTLTTFQEQDGYIFQGSVWENLFTDDAHRTQAQAYLDVFAFGKPLSYAITAEAGNLSLGERQKLLLVRALLQDSTFLILDEPLNNMDAVGAKNLMAQLEQRKGLIVITHQDTPLSLQTKYVLPSR